MNRKLIHAAILVAALPACSALGQTPSHEAVGTHANVTPAIQWKAGPPSLPTGAQVALLEGDPGKEGMFVLRLKLPDGFHIPAHTHPKPERITVIQGTFKLAMGENPILANAKRLATGTYNVCPEGMIHAAWSEGETIVQLHGVGPWAINYVNPADDPRNKKK